jgi:hypothetical protein
LVVGGAFVHLGAHLIYQIALESLHLTQPELELRQLLLVAGHGVFYSALALDSGRRGIRTGFGSDREEGQQQKRTRDSGQGLHASIFHFLGLFFSFLIASVSQMRNTFTEIFTLIFNPGSELTCRSFHNRFMCCL